MKRTILVLAALVLVVATTLSDSGFPSGIPTARAGVGGGEFYLALGDSLSVGYQPGRGETRKGYVDDLWRRVRKEQISGLDLRNVGCPGETSASMITGNHSLCQYAAGSQLDAAVNFLEQHPGEVAFITIDIGANDFVFRCLDFDTGRSDRACAADMLPRLQARLARILGTLGTAGPGVPIVGMTYYDPFLGLWGLVPGGRPLARASLRSFNLLNTGLAEAYEEAGATVAKVAKTFRIKNFAETVRVPGRGRIPINVALTCRWTWFCSPTFFGDPHANRTGYQQIARTFYRELEGLLP